MQRLAICQLGKDAHWFQTHCKARLFSSHPVRPWLPAWMWASYNFLCLVPHLEMVGNHLNYVIGVL